MADEKQLASDVEQGEDSDTQAAERAMADANASRIQAPPPERALVTRDVAVERNLRSQTSEIDEMRMVQAWGRLMAASGFFPDTRSEAQAAVKILAGRELGFTAMQSMIGFHVIDGKITASAHLMAHAVKRSGKYDYRVRQHSADCCRIEFFQKTAEGWESLGDSQFTEADAVQAGLGERSLRSPEKPSNWEKYPRNMLFSRAMSNGIAWYCPDVFDTRVYTPDEIRPDLDLTSDGDVQDIEAIVVMPREPIMDNQPDTYRQGAAPRTASRAGRGSAPEPTPPQPRERQKRDALDLDDVTNLQTLQTWQWSKFRGDSPRVCELLGVESIAEIAQRYTTPEQFRDAAGLLWAGFDPGGYEAHIAATTEAKEEADQGSGQVAATDEQESPE